MKQTSDIYTLYKHVHCTCTGRYGYNDPVHSWHKHVQMLYLSPVHLGYRSIKDLESTHLMLYESLGFTSATSTQSITFFRYNFHQTHQF